MVTFSGDTAVITGVQPSLVKSPYSVEDDGTQAVKTIPVIANMATAVDRRLVRAFTEFPFGSVLFGGSCKASLFNRA